MKEVLEKGWLNIAAVIFIILVFFQTCGIKGRITKTDKKIETLEERIDSLHNELNSKVIDEALMIKLIKKTPAWKTLRLEEISDKEKISINALEEKDK